jgi:transposase-like protein
MENNLEVLSGLVLKRIRGGRCLYDPQVKQELVTRALVPGVSVAALAMQHAVNANLLRKWITKSQRQSAQQQTACEKTVQNTLPFLALPVNIGVHHAPVRVSTKTSAASGNSIAQPMQLRIQLPNGVAVDLGETRLQDLSTVMQALCTLSCSA